VDECRTSPCQQICNNTIGSYAYSCHTGYQRQEGSLCVGKYNIRICVIVFVSCCANAFVTQSNLQFVQTWTNASVHLASRCAAMWSARTDVRVAAGISWCETLDVLVRNCLKRDDGNFNESHHFCNFAKYLNTFGCITG
jgi:hypothetical protein